MADSTDSPSQQSSSRVEGRSQSNVMSSAFDSSFSSSPPAFDATAIMILPPHQLGFPRLDAAQPPACSLDGTSMSSLHGKDAWIIASTSSTPSSVSSFAFSPVSPSWSDGPSSSLPCSPGTSFEDAAPNLPALPSSSHVKGKARAAALSQSLSLPSLDTSAHMPRANLTMSPQQLDSLTISSCMLMSASCNAPPSSSPGPSSNLSSVTSGSRRRLTKTRPDAQSKLTRRNTLAIDRLLDESRAGTSIGVTYETASALKPHATLPSRRDLRKGRSYTVPDPIVWNPQHDAVDDTDEDMSATIVLAPRSTFDSRLPREVKLSVFASLLCLHEAEHVKRVRSSEWTSVKAGMDRYVGREKGFVELVKLSCVSRSWQALAFDGQLWAHLDMHALVQMPEATVTRIIHAAGAFMRSVSLEGYTRLTTSILRQFNASIVLAQPGRKSLPVSQLTALDLSGCKAVTTKVLHELILVSPGLQHVSFKGVPAVTNVTCVILGRTCPQLLSLNLSRCRNIDAAGVISVASAPIGATVSYTQLKELRLSGLRSASAALMVTLARGAPYLEILDLSYSIGLVDSDFEVFTAWRSEWDAFDGESPFEKIPLTAREMGYDPADSTRYFKRLSKLRHLNISHCTLLTDAACGHMSYSLPLLETLELAGLGPDLEDDGVVRLLRTTPHIRKIDLEDATEISNAVLETLTLDVDELRARRVRPQAFDAYPGERLEHLILSSCGRITTDAATALIRSCKHLHVLEVDGTRASGSLVREFCRHAKRHGHEGTEINVSDCRGLPGDSLVRELAPHTRHRRGWRGWDARRLRFLDSEGDCNESRVLFKSFWTWQASDAARTARDKKIRAAVSAGTATALEGAELTQLLEAEELTFRDPIDERNARFRWVKVLGQLSPSSESCVIM